MKNIAKFILNVVTVTCIMCGSLAIYNKSVDTKIVNVASQVTEIGTKNENSIQETSEETRNLLTEQEAKLIEYHSLIEELEKTIDEQSKEIEELNSKLLDTESKLETLETKLNSVATKQKTTALQTDVPVATAKQSSMSYDIITFEKGTSTSVQNKIKQAWDNCPENIKNTLRNNGWQIVLSKHSLSERLGFGYSIAGCAVTGEKILYIDNRDKAVNRALYHEMGHALDSINGWYSNTEEFKSIFEEEKGNFQYSIAIGDNHETSDYLEYFASVADEIIRGYDSRLQQEVPKSYAYVKKIFS